MRFDTKNTYQLIEQITTPLKFEGEAVIKNHPYPDLQIKKLNEGDEWLTWQMGSYVDSNNGMFIPNPMFIVRLWKFGTAEALSYVNMLQNYTVYTHHDGVNYIDAQAEKIANSQLNKWLLALTVQGYKYELKPPVEEYKLMSDIGLVNYDDWHRGDQYLDTSAD